MTSSTKKCSGVSSDEIVDVFGQMKANIPPGVEIVYDDEYSTHAHGFSKSAAFLQMPLEKLFQFCDIPPLSKFTISFVYRLNPETVESVNRQCLFHLFRDDKTQISVLYYKNKVILKYGGKPPLKEIRLAHINQGDSNRWHSLHLHFNPEVIFVSIDCERSWMRTWRGFLYLPLEVKKWDLNIANCDVKETKFHGLMKDLKVQIGESTSYEDCTLPRSPRKRHSLIEMRLRSGEYNWINSKPKPKLDYPKPEYPKTVFPKAVYPKNDATYIADKTFSIGDKVCYFQSRGDVWFDAQTKTLRMCYSGLWEPRPPVQVVPMPFATNLQKPQSPKEKLDYPVWHQNLPSASPFADLEVFTIENEGLFMVAAAYKDNFQGKLDSPIYKWIKGKFEHYQNISTNSAMCWEHFSIGKQFFLAVANFGYAHRDSANVSVIYRWDKHKKLFLHHQEIATWAARDIEHFTIRREHYLAIANHGRKDSFYFPKNPTYYHSYNGSLDFLCVRNGKQSSRTNILKIYSNLFILGHVNSIHSVIYKWNKKKRMFSQFQPIRTSSATDWTYFKINRQHFLLGSNSFGGSSTRINSILYVWKGNTFMSYQRLPTRGASDWEYFKFQNGHYIVVANALDTGPHQKLKVDAYRTESTIFRFNHGTKAFESFQNITTNSATDWEFFTLGDDSFLVHTNMQFSKDVVDHRSVIYRWQGIDGFAPVHRMLTGATFDWESFSDNGISYLVYADGKETMSRVLRLKTVS
ncbi:thrombospondin-type laminin G domain and EAR repeat-containing protein-like [Lineus longissimus]|uniref:thrombospondin-type laminin G domain and EAR repeat-containing protein-like n=1 Tax=Lineus longissimus TaxID=88925 RepID=UPI00315C8A47